MGICFRDIVGTGTPRKQSILKTIEFKDVSFSYSEGASGKDGGIPSNQILENVTFSIDQGSYTALIGLNGSGKSTIARLCEAFLTPNSGIVRILGEDTRGLDADGTLRLRRRLGYVFQNPDDQFVSSRVIDEVSFGPANLGLDPQDVISRTADALDAVGMIDFLGRNVNTLSGGEKQRIAIADALAMDPEILILDEPASMLDAAGAAAVKRILRDLNRRGMTIVLITHDMHEAAEADRILLLQEGHVSQMETPVDQAYSQASFRDAETASGDEAEGIHRVSKAYGNANGPFESNEHGTACLERREMAPVPVNGSAIVRFSDVSFEYDLSDDPLGGILGADDADAFVFSGLDLEIGTGEAVALMGPNGSGKSTALQLMNGLLTPTTGVVEIEGIPTDGRAGCNHARNTVGLCYQFPERSIFSRTVYDEIAFGPRNQGLTADETDSAVRDAMASMGLDFESMSRMNPFLLSGGLQRRVSIASVLATDPKVLALDEPAAGLDRPAHDALMALLMELKAKGTAIVLVTHSESDADIVSDRIITLGR